MLVMIAVLTFFILFILLFLLINTYLADKGVMEIRLKSLENMTRARTDIDQELSKSFRQRIVMPLISEVASWLAPFTPLYVRKMVEQMMLASGGGSMGTDEFLLLCAFFACSLPGVVFVLTRVGKIPANMIGGFSLIACAIGLVLPFVILRQRVEARKQSIQKALPDVLDLLTVSVEAGLGFDGALVKLTKKMKGALIEEFDRALQEMRIGVARREALLSLGLRCGVSELSTFTASLIQADHLGVSIGKVLRVQAGSIREKRRQRAQEAAMRAPVKMMLPLVLFIFPIIFIILLGPAAIQIMSTMFK